MLQLLEALDIALVGGGDFLDFPLAIGYGAIPRLDLSLQLLDGLLQFDPDLEPHALLVGGLAW